MKKRGTKRLLALALCLCLVAFGRPVPALAMAGTDVAAAPGSAVTSTPPAASAPGSEESDEESTESIPPALTSAVPQEDAPQPDAPAGSGLGPDVEPPAIQVTLSEAANALAPAPRAGSVTVGSWAELKAAVAARAADIEFFAGSTFSVTETIVVDYPVTIHNAGAAREISFTGVLFDVRDGGALTLQDMKLAGQNLANADRLVTVASGGSLTLGNGAVLHSSTGGGVYVDGGALTMRDGSGITGNTADEGGGVYLTGSTATFQMEGGEITGNETTDAYPGGHGGGVYVAGGAKMTMSGTAQIGGAGQGNITGVNGRGGGVYLTGAGSRLDMAGGGILGNSARFGGGVYVDGGAQMTLSGTAQIGGSGSGEGNASANRGGGVYLAGADSALTMTGGGITGNTANAGEGGGVYVSNGTFTLTDGSIADNSAGESGGGMMVGSGGTFIMDGGSVTGNTALGDYGGGVYLANGAFTMNGGSITGNRAKRGGGVTVAVASGNTFTMKDGEVGDNTTAGVIGVGVSTASDDVFDHQGGRLFVTPADWAALKAAVEDAGAPTKPAATEVLIGGNLYAVDNGTTTTGTIKVTRKLAIHSAAIPGAPFTITRDGGFTGNFFNVGSGGDLTLENVALDGNKDIVNVDASLVLVENGGKLTLGGGAALKDNFVQRISNGGAVYVDGGTLTMQDGSSISKNAGHYGGGVYLAVGSSFNMLGGSISGNDARLGGGGVYLDNRSVNPTIFTMQGGSITDNKADGNGGGVCVRGKGKQFVMTGGAITGNSADEMLSYYACGGGVYVDGGATMSMSGAAQIGGSGTGEGNEAFRNGGGVYVTDTGSSFNMTGGKIIGNKASGSSPDGNGGGVAVASGATMKMSGAAQIGGGTGEGNTARSGGGVYVTGADSKLDMTGGRILGNRAASSGGGVCVGGGATMNTSGAAQIGGGSNDEGNTADNGGGVYLNGAGSLLTMTGGRILGNQGSRQGGGVYVDGGATMKMSGAAQIGGSGLDEGNEAPNGAGVCVWGTDSKLDMQGGSILGNETSAAGPGGGVYVAGAGSRFDMTGGRILGNEAGDGGGVQVSAGATMNMSGTAQIGGSAPGEGNKANNGGGVYVAGDTFHMTGGSVTGNTAIVNGMAVYVASAQDVEIQGGLVAARGGDTVYVNNTGVTFTVSGGAVMQTDPNGRAITSKGSGEDKVQIKGNGTVYSRGKAVVYDDPALTFPGPSGNGLVILQTDDNAPYKAGTDNDLRYTPAATVQWALENGAGGIRYEKGSNAGFLPLGVAVNPVDPPPSLYILTVEWGQGGKVSGTASGSYAKDTAILAEATADPGYRFTGWTADGITIDTKANPLTFKMPDKPVTLTANFTKDEAPDPGPSYTWRTLYDPDTGVKASGYFTSSAALEVKDRLLHAKGDCEVCDDIRTRQDRGELIALFDIGLASGKYTGSLDVEIPVEAKYNGQEVLIIHCKDKVLESRTVKAENGLAKGTFSSLSPFAVVQAGAATIITGLPKDYTLLVGRSVSWTPAPAGGAWSYDKDMLSMTQDGDTYTFTALKTGRATATYTVDGMPHTINITINASAIPQTGNPFNPWPYLLLMLAALAGCISLLLYRKCRYIKRHG